MERSIEKEKVLYMCLIEFEKAFDTVKYDCLMTTLKKYGEDGRDIIVLNRLYWEQKAVVRVGEDVSERSIIETGVKQDYVLSPDLFSLYTKLLMEEMSECERMEIGGKNVNNIRYTDNMVMEADSKDKLQSLLDR